MRTSAPLLRVRDLSLTHAGSAHPSPREVTFDISPGEVALLLGPSGSGKSTLTLALNGLLPHAVPATMTGSVTVLGHDVASTPTSVLSRHVGMVFQDPDAQIVTGTVYDEVAFGPENLLLPLDEITRRTDDALRRVGLWERRDENPDRLSGGGRQRLAIACALALGSELIVLDEPTANLDSQGIDDVYAALEDLISAGDRALVLVEHNLDAALRFVTRALVLDRDGRLAFDGPARDILRDHTDELAEMGVWLPSAALAARRLRAQGVVLDPLPLTPDELRDALMTTDAVRKVAQHEMNAQSWVPEPVEGPPSSSANRKGDPEGDREEAVLVRARGLTVVRSRREILRDIDLDIFAGSITAIIGANGAGKTTLIQSLAGVVPPPRRQVNVDGLDPSTASPRELAARIGFVFQNPEHQFITATVFDELAHGLRLRGAETSEVDARVHEMLVRFGLEAKAERHPFLLSGGEKRRLSVGTALITHPRVLALDEPTFGQDRARATEMLALLRDLRDEGTTILLVTHDLQLVADHATHTVILADGRVTASGRTAEIFLQDQLFAAADLRLPPLFRALPPAMRQLNSPGAR